MRYLELQKADESALGEELRQLQKRREALQGANPAGEGTEGLVAAVEEVRCSICRVRYKVEGDGGARRCRGGGTM